VGGSLGGLAAGLALKFIGHDTTILERNPTPLLEQQGAGIVAGGDTLAFFQRYNRCDRPFAVTSHRRQYLDKQGNVVHKEDMDQNMTSVSCDYSMPGGPPRTIQAAYPLVALARRLVPLGSSAD
jgi:2-polyprenyl-6-methoxyphenol hydroxylase-like FAD-dependent oxidoreductase